MGRCCPRTGGRRRAAAVAADSWLAQHFRLKVYHCLPCRIILAASSGFFRALLCGAWRQQQEGCGPAAPAPQRPGVERWTLSGVDGPSLQLLLAAIYSKRLPLTADGVSQDIPRLLAASNYLEVGAGRGRSAPFRLGLALAAWRLARLLSLYARAAHICLLWPSLVSLQVLPVKEACCQYLRSQLSLETVAATLSLAAAHDCTDLLADAVRRWHVHALEAGWDGLNG